MNMRKRQPPRDLVLSDDEVRDVIARAVRAPRDPGVTIAELQQIAAELDIDPKALELALDQVVGMPIPGKPIRSWLKRQLTKIGRVADAFLPQSGRLVGFAMFGVIAGWLNAFLMTFSINGHYPIAAAMIGLTIANLLSRRLDRKLTRYITETLAAWISYAVAWSVTYGGVTDNLVVWVVFWTSQATMLAYLLMRDSSESDDGSPIAATTPGSDPAVRFDHDNTVNRVMTTYRALLWSSFLRPRSLLLMR
jgi:hypothetical protein